MALVAMKRVLDFNDVNISLRSSLPRAPFTSDSAIDNFV
jgi:hypothetical protein